MNKNILYLASIMLLFFSCEDLIEPAIENNRSLDGIYDEPRFAQGLLINGYARIPTNNWVWSDMATDNAVSSNRGNNFYALSTGQWAANNNPLEQWNNAFSAFQYLNIAISELDSVTYAENVAVNQMFIDRLTGEAYGLRSLFMYYLLQAHGGMAGGTMLGVPIILDFLDKDSEFNRPRATFQECMVQFYADAQRAIELLPTDYANIGDVSGVPQKYLDLEGDLDDYNRVFGDDARLLISGRIVRAVRAQASLMAASPAFAQGNNTTWEEAANFAAEVIDFNGGISGIDPNGDLWYTDQDGQINSVGSGLSAPEILWRTDIGGPSSFLEEQHYPPTLFGDGLLNPTQNLVDAFPMSNGYPITDPASGYDPNSPYTNRDPRFSAYIIYNGSTAGINGVTINTAEDGSTNDAIGAINNLSTRTGYYMKKLLRQDVNLNPNSVNGQLHVNPRIRYTEIYLDYAEAANEAFGPMGTGSNGYSAYDVIKAIRARAGVGAGNGDAYLESVKSDQVAMREIIRNERRLELCFEGFRFWDLRRWGVDLTDQALGMAINDGEYRVISVDNRVYENYMIYGPIPYIETLKFSALEQNTGW